MKEIKFTAIPLAARPETSVWQVLIEQSSAGQAQLFQDGTSYLVQFSDEPEPIPFDQLGYNSDIGLYDKRHFPDIH
jgi:hypothetical protein